MQWYSPTVLRGKESRIWSQDGADGVLEWTFKNIGVEHGACVDLGAGGYGDGSNVRQWIDKGWRCWGFDGAPRSPGIVQAWIRDDTINSLLRRNSVPLQVDLLSIDLDGQDYWVMDALNCCRPRVVVAEFNPRRGAQSIARNPNHAWDGTDYYGCTWGAWEHWAAQRGYVMLHNLSDQNAVMCLRELAPDARATQERYTRWHPMDEQGREWVDVRPTP